MQYTRKQIRIFVAHLIIVNILVISCGEAQKDIEVNYAEKYGLKETTKFAFQLEQAILYSNSLLSDSINYRFKPTWKTSMLCPELYFINANESQLVVFKHIKSDSFGIKGKVYFNNAIPIPVYLIDDYKLAESENVFVPNGELCVFINVHSIKRFWQDLGISRSYGNELTRIHTIFFSLVLLHEMGHISNGDYGSYTVPTSLSATEVLNEKSNNREFLADLFAINQIRRNHKTTNDKPKESFSKSVLAIDEDLILGDIYRCISAVNSDFEITKDVWGIFDGNKKSLLLSQKGYSHPNIYLRFLIMKYKIDEDDETLLTINKLLKE